ncbi:MAG: hypothetical protein WC076_02565 [Terrimicrobiaceae bacterium]|jgi:hypothetical protein
MLRYSDHASGPETSPQTFHDSKHNTSPFLKPTISRNQELGQEHDNANPLVTIRDRLQDGSSKNTLNPFHTPEKMRLMSAFSTMPSCVSFFFDAQTTDVFTELALGLRLPPYKKTATKISLDAI